MDEGLSIAASIVTIVGAVIGLLGSDRERQGLQEVSEEKRPQASDAERHRLNKVVLWSLIARTAAGVAVILSATAYLLATWLYSSDRDYVSDAAEVFIGGSILLGLLAALGGIVAFALPVKVLQATHGWLFASFTIAMGGILVMLAAALDASNI